MTLSGCGLSNLLPETAAEKAARYERDRWSREQAVEREREKALAREQGHIDTCTAYGYKKGTPDFNQCVANEKRQYEQKKALADMAEEAERRAANEIAREQAAEKRSQNREFFRDLDATRQRNFERATKRNNEFLFGGS